MSAYLIELEFETDRFGGPHACLAVRSPFWTKKDAVPITADCMTPLELETWGNEAKKKIDAAVRAGKRKFAENEKKRRQRP